MKLKITIPLSLLLLLAIVLFAFYQRVVYSIPENSSDEIVQEERIQIGKDSYQLGNSWLRKNESGNWESYIEGNAVERGQIIGRLHQELIIGQEDAFVGELKKQIPNSFYRRLLTLSIAWFNRDLDQYIPLEYRTEIAGISQYFSYKYDFIGPKYNRLINYHAAHDIGHAVQNMRLVGCTAFGVWSDRSMLVGRNFDFYVGDAFAKEKIVLLMNPDEGYKFLSVTWGGFCGVVSGMNEKGLGITLNSLKSEIPDQVGTPVSIIARDMLQYAGTIEEAAQIADRHTSFVSESFTISSAIDGKIAIIEKTPTQTEIYWPSDTVLIAANHCQSDELKNSPINLEHMANSESVNRYKRAEQLLGEIKITDENDIATILRDQKGLNDKNIGISNPELINQLIAHHAVIFKNYEKQVWVSSYPYQINSFQVYDLDNFDQWASGDLPLSAAIDSLQIPADPFYQSRNYKQFEEFKSLKKELIIATKNEIELESETIQSFIKTNPEYYETYRLIGNYFAAVDNPSEAINYYQMALSKEIAYKEDSLFIIDQIRSLTP